MVWVAVLYALAGSLLTHTIGRPLIGLNFARQRVEADFRFGLVRLRENAEGVALYGGERTEQSGLRDRVERIRANWWQLMGRTKRLTFMTVGYDQIGSVFPLLVAAPRYFSGDISLGVLTQISNAFGQVQGSLSWFLESYGLLAAWKATVDRLLTFRSAMSAAQLAPGSGIDLVVNGTADVRADHVDLALPDGRVLLANTSVVITPGERLLIPDHQGLARARCFVHSLASGHSVGGASRCRPRSDVFSCPSGRTFRSPRCEMRSRIRRRVAPTTTWQCVKSCTPWVSTDSSRSSTTSKTGACS